MIPEVLVTEASQEDCDLAVAAAVATAESSGGHNVWGHDKTLLPDNELPYRKGAPVTEAAYREYLRMRGADGKGPGGMQGVGGLQLTWWELQDQADREGGCWLPRPNTRVGCRHLASLLRRNTVEDALSRYNTGDPGATPYSRKVLPMVQMWRGIIVWAGAEVHN